MIEYLYTMSTMLLLHIKTRYTHIFHIYTARHKCKDKREEYHYKKTKQVFTTFQKFNS